MGFLGDRDEVFELPEVHNRSLSCTDELHLGLITAAKLWSELHRSTHPGGDFK
jgi:hypothetical protein